MHEICNIRKGILQVQEAKGVYFTVIVGGERAIVMDTGHGIADNRSFVEAQLTVPYLVINSHGHPDHTQGNVQFEEVYLHEADFVAYENCNTETRRRDSYRRFAAANRLPKEGEEAFAKAKKSRILPLPGECVYDLGGLHVRVVELPGHTKGTIGLLVEEERLLLSGDAFNPDMWMFADNHDTLETLEATLTKALSLPFDTYLGGHTTAELPREFLQEVRANVQGRAIDWNSREIILGKETYAIRHTGSHGASSIRIMAEDALTIKRSRPRGFNTALLHGGAGPDVNGSMLPPIYQTSAFAHESAEEIAAVFAKEIPGYNYSRISNPTIMAFEARMTELEQGAASVACASGMAAITYAVLELLKTGDEFLAGCGLYGGTIELFNSFENFGIKVRYVHLENLKEVEAAIGPKTKLIFGETISNPALEVLDIAAVAEIAHAHELAFVVDNTMATPFLTKPLTLGADAVVNSASKYINGSGDAISGVVTGKDADYIAGVHRNMVRSHGGCLSPQNAFLNLLGSETLGLRMERECSNALALAEHLSGIPGLTVNYPGLPDSKYHELAKAQLKGGYGNMLTIRTGSKEKAFAFINALKLPFIVSNIGDTRTLVVHPDTTTARSGSPQEKLESGVLEDLIRVSVGIEDIGDLLADFDRAAYDIL